MFRHLWYFHIFHVWAWSDCQMGEWGRKSNRGISTTNKAKQTNQSEQFNEQTNQTLLTNSSPTVGKSTRFTKWSCSLRRAWMRWIQPPFLCIPKIKPSSIQLQLSSSAMHWHLQHHQWNPQEQKKTHLKETKNNTSKSNIQRFHCCRDYFDRSSLAVDTDSDSPRRQVRGDWTRRRHRSWPGDHVIPTWKGSMASNVTPIGLSWPHFWVAPAKILSPQ